MVDNIGFNINQKIIHRLCGENVTGALYELSSCEKLDVNGLQSYKDFKLGELLRFAINNIEYYCNSNESINRFNDIKIVDKHIIRSNYDKFISRFYKGETRSTSGTTGEPFVFTKDKHATAHMNAMMYLAYSWHGLKVGDPQARIWGRPIDKKSKVMQLCKDRILNRIRLSAFEFNVKNCRRFYELLKKFKPKYFYCYSNALYQFALFIEKADLNGSLLGIKIAICTGEVLYSFQREKIEDIFECRVVNEYGSTESGIIGFECEHGTMHIVPTVLVEIDKPNQKGIGEILITELNSRSMPFIRYRNGDRGRILKEKCQCGRAYEALEISEGRIDDYIKCPNGNMVYDSLLAYTLKEFSYEFKVWQKSLNKLVIDIVPLTEKDIEVRTKIKNNLKKYLGEEMEISIHFVKKIPIEKSGKMRYFISEI